MRGHACQIDIAGNDIGDIAAAVLCRARKDVPLVDMAEFDLDLLHDLFGIFDGQPNEQVGVCRYQRFHLCYYRSIEVIVDLRRVLGVAGRRQMGGLRRIGVRRGGRCLFSGVSLGRRDWFGWRFLPRRIRQHRIGIDGVQDTEMAGAERLFCAGRACTSHRGVGCRDGGGDVGQDRLNMAERGAGKLPRTDPGQQSALCRREIVGVGSRAFGYLGGPLGAVLPNVADRRPRRSVEGRAEVEKIRSG